MIDGFLLIDKKEGLTSRKVCNQISFKLQEKKVGHIGTLDPFATGLLIVTLGKANKAGQFLEKENKRYIAELKLGEETDSLDNTGNIISKKEVPLLNKEDIKKVLNSFLGESKQIPPMTSAIHVNGVKLYKLAHKGIEIEREPRDIVIKEIKLINYINNVIKFECEVSSGTYIRVLAKDIANKLGTVGHLISLRRTKIGEIDVKDAIDIDDIKLCNLISIFDVLKSVSEIVEFNDTKIKDVMDGKIEFINHKSNNEKLLIINKNKEPIAMYVRIDVDKYQFKRGLF